MDKSRTEVSREGEILRRIAVEARRMRRAQERLLGSSTSEEALDAAREEARALRSLDEALAEFSLPPEAGDSPATARLAEGRSATS